MDLPFGCLDLITERNILKHDYLPHSLLPCVKIIEDDMTIDLDTKIPYLKTFHEIIYQKGWTFTKSKKATLTSSSH